MVLTSSSTTDPKPELMQSNSSQSVMSLTCAGCRATLAYLVAPVQGAWFLWDFSFYGNKIFQSSFIKILSPNATILVNLLWTLLNSFVALLGYYLAAAVIDNVRVGRLRLQLLGFAMVSTASHTKVKVNSISQLDVDRGTCTWSSVLTSFHETT